MPTETADWVGLTLDRRYAVTAKLGEGGMGFVYRAKDARLGCDVVVKVPRAAMLEDAGFRQRFQDEVGALVKLAHPHVVKVTDFGQHDGVPFAVMQFLEAGSLEDRRPKDAAGQPKAVAPRSLNEWLLPVAEALDFIHKKGYVHRDVKPANILFDADKNAYISDFGVAKAVATNQSAGAGITGAGLVLGTPTYMAPELVNGELFGGKVDQYALAVTVFELLAGRPPFDGPTPIAVFIKRTTEEPPVLAEVRPGTAAGISAAVGKALSKDPAQRFPNCAAFAKAVLAAVTEGATHPVGRGKKPPLVVTAPRTSQGETPRGGIKPETGQDYPLAALVDDTARAPSRKISPPRAAGQTGNSRALIIGLTGGSAVLAALMCSVMWLAMASKEPRHPSSDINQPGTKNLQAQQPEPKKHGSGIPPALGVTDLRPEPATVELLAGGAWVPVDIAVERTGTGAVTVDLVPPLGVEVKSQAVTVEADEPARFELRAAPAAVRHGGMMARLTVRGTKIHRALPVVLKSLDFEATLASPGEVALAAGQEKAVELKIDRSGGYTGIITIDVPATPALQGTTMTVAANATLATVPLTVRPNVRPGTVTVSIDFTGADVRRSLAVTLRVIPAAEVRAFVGHAGPVEALSLSADGKLAVSGGADGTVRLWDIATGQEKWKGEGHSGPVRSVAFSPDGQHIVSGGSDKTVRIWDAATGGSRLFSVAGLADPGHGSAVWLVRFDDARTVRSVSADKTIHWIAATGKPRQIPDGRRDLILGQKYKADIGPGQELAPATGIPTDSGEYVLSGVGTTIATLSKRGADKSAPRPVAHTPELNSRLKVIAVSGTGSRLLTIGEDNGLRMWDIVGLGTASRVAKAVPGYPWPADYDVTCAVLDVDGQQVLLGGRDGVLKLWGLPTDAAAPPGSSPKPADGRSFWRFSPQFGSGYFRMMPDGKWEERTKANGRLLGTWEELNRTPGYVELYDPKRNHKTRLGAGKAWRATGRESTKFVSSPAGNWEQPDGSRQK